MYYEKMYTTTPFWKNEDERTVLNVATIMALWKMNGAIATYKEIASMYGLKLTIINAKGEVLNG